LVIRADSDEIRRAVCEPIGQKQGNLTTLINRFVRRLSILRIEEALGRGATGWQLVIHSTMGLTRKWKFGREIRCGRDEAD
jgi:hypothetical protein